MADEPWSTGKLTATVARSVGPDGEASAPDTPGDRSYLVRRQSVSALLGLARMVLGTHCCHQNGYRADGMAYDTDLAHRVREQLVDEAGVSEIAMFGGLAFLLNGNMAVGLSSGGELMVRVGPDGTDNALARPYARLFDMTGRPMKGWILVSPEGVRTKRQLAAWVRRGVEFARTLPAKAR